LLAEAPYPEVVVAKAWSHNGKDLDVVGQEGATLRTRLSLERLVKAEKYAFEQGGVKKTLLANVQGKAIVEVLVEGRTQFFLKPDA